MIGNLQLQKGTPQCRARFGWLVPAAFAAAMPIGAILAVGIADGNAGVSASVLAIGVGPSTLAVAASCLTRPDCFRALLL